jgi:hypothetical protein
MLTLTPNTLYGQWPHAFLAAAILTSIIGCGEFGSGGGTRSVNAGGISARAVYGYSGDKKLGFVMFTDVASEGTVASGGSAWTGSITPKMGQAVDYKGSANGLEINGSQYNFTNGRVFLVSAKDDNVSVRQLNMPIKDASYASEIDRIVKTEEVQQFLSTTPPTDSAGAQPDDSTDDGSTFEDDSQPTEDTVDSRATPEIAESTDTAAAVSATLKQAMIDLMKERQPDTEPDAVRSQVESAIVQIRKDVPEFLVVSTETEEKLEAGIPVQNATKRIADAEAFLNENAGQLSGIVQWLLPQHKAGNLDAVRTELLAQLIVADMKKVQDALTN